MEHEIFGSSGCGQRWAKILFYFTKWDQIHLKIFNYGMLESPLTRFTTSHHNPSFPVIPLAVLVAGLLIAAAGRLDAGRFMGPQSGEFPDEPFEPIALEAHQCHGPFHPKNYPTKELYFPRVPYIYIVVNNNWNNNISGWWLGTWILFFHREWKNHPNWRTNIFFRGVGRKTTNQILTGDWWLITL